MTTGDAVRKELERALGFHQSGRLDAAESIYLTILEADPDQADALHFLGVLRHQTGDHETAAEMIGRAVELAPGRANFLLNLGNVRQAQGKSREAADCFRKAVAADPESAVATANLSAAVLAMGEVGEAVAAGRRAVALAPDMAQAHFNLGNAFQADDRSPEAMACYRRAIGISPDYADAHGNLARELRSIGDYGQAMAAFDRAIALGGGENPAGLKVQRAMCLPTIPSDVAEISAARQTMRENLEALIAEGITLEDPYKQIGQTSFFLAYHGQSDRELQTTLASLFRQACPSLEWTAPHLQGVNQGGGASPGGGADNRKARLGFASIFLHNHTMGAQNRGLIKQLDREKFEVIVFRNRDRQDSIGRFIEEAADKVVNLPSDLTDARQAIAGEQLDILHYTDIGMEPLTYFLGFSRLARVQTVAWGHPNTTGIPNIDYFISGDPFDHDDGQADYSEHLVRLKHYPNYFYPYDPPDPLPARADFGLPEKGHIYLCPQSLFKLHPDFDPFIADILKADPQGILVLIEAACPQWTERLKSRFARTLSNCDDRVVFVPPQPPDLFRGLLCLADAILDPPEFSGGQTTYEAFCMGVPVVTLPIQLARGRLTYALYQTMHMTDLIAETRQDYVKLALRLGADPGWRAEMSAKISLQVDYLTRNLSFVREWEEFMLKALTNAQFGRKLA